MTRELSHKAGAALLKSAFSTKNASLTHTEALNLLAQLKGYQAWSHLQQATAKDKRPKEAKKPKAKLELLSLSKVLQSHYGARGEFSALPRDEWRADVHNKSTGQGYWDWVVSTLEARDLLCCDTEFNPMPTAEVTLPNGKRSRWWLENNLTDRWGDFNEHASNRKPGLALLQLDEALALDENLLERLQQQMCDETTFLARKDGKFGLLFEVEYTSRESEAQVCGDDPAELKQYKPHEEVVAALLRGLQTVQEVFPSLEMCVPNSDEIIWNRPAVWAFVPLDSLNEQERSTLSIMLSTL